MDILRDCNRIFADDVQRRIVFSQIRSDKLTVQVIHRYSGAQEVWAAVENAAQIRGMAAGAITVVERFASQQHILRSERPNELRKSVW
jgi:ABC-type hemin transport system substrate-binding protein